MMSLARSSLHQGCSALAGCRRLVAAVQHPAYRSYTSNTSAASPDGAGFSAAGATSGRSNNLQHSAVMYVGWAAASPLQQLCSSSVQSILAHVLCAPAWVHAGSLALKVAWTVLQSNKHGDRLWLVVQRARFCRSYVHALTVCFLCFSIHQAVHAHPPSIIRNSTAICAATCWAPAEYEAGVQGVPQVDNPLVFATWSVYHPKGALNLRPQKAEWELAGKGYYMMKK